MAASTFSLITHGKVNIDPARVANFLRSSDGPVYRKMIEVGEAVKVETVRSLKDGFPRDFLGPSVVKRIETTGSGIRVLVGSDHITTEPHQIVGNPVLAFTFPKAGAGVFFFRSVNHPGSNFYKYLTGRLLEAAAVVGRTIH